MYGTDEETENTFDEIVQKACPLGRLFLLARTTGLEPATSRVH
jgi:hypothetical protein